MPRPLDILIDLTAIDSLTHTQRDGAGWSHPERFTVRARQITWVVPPQRREHFIDPSRSSAWRMVSATSAIAACSESISRAGADQAELLILQGPVEASDEALFAMREGLDRDPMFGAAIARIGCETGCCLRTLSKHGLEDGQWIPRRTLAEVDDVEICPEVFSPVLLMAPQILGEFGELDARFASLPFALVHYLSRARRHGHRIAVANRAVMTVRGARCNVAYPAPKAPEGDRALLGGLVSDLERGWVEFRAGSNERFELLTADAFRVAAGDVRPSLLLDIRNVVALQNGTTRAVLNSLTALRRLSPAWTIEVLATETAARFHCLSDLCNGWRLHTSLPSRLYTAALRLSQPWHIQEMVDLHRAALINVYFMLDTISWDVVYAAPPHHDGTWSFLADHADGFLYDSAFTERRFVGRFGRARGKPSAVCHYPFDPADYVFPEARRTAPSDYILVIGNELDHKDVPRTVELLARAFPFRTLVTLGPRLAESPRVRVYRAGNVPEIEIHRLYAGSRIIVFPSFYEGFGFPIVTALAYGKTLIARRSELLTEIAERCPTGQLVTFTRRNELVEIIGRLLHGEPVDEEVRVGRAATPLRTWQDVARDITNFLNSLVSEPSGTRWLERERAVNQLLAFRG